MAGRAIDWAAIHADSRFQALHRKKRNFLTLLMALSVVYYFLLPVGAAWWPALFRLPVYGAVNAGILLALSEFVVALVVAACYTRRANQEFDRLAEDIRREIMLRHLQERSR